MFLWNDIRQRILNQFPGYPAVADERPFLYVDSQEQRLFLVDIDADLSRDYLVSTSASGLGNLKDSHKTPFGVHRIREKIGGGQPRCMIFKGRQPTGCIADPREPGDGDVITSRILWLDGLEPGVNQGGDRDSYGRFIYIHGTQDEQRIGQPVSIGCIRMTNDDVIELFDTVLVNDLVIIR